MIYTCLSCIHSGPKLIGRRTVWWCPIIHQQVDASTENLARLCDCYTPYELLPPEISDGDMPEYLL
jgi:hypothetical protein